MIEPCEMLSWAARWVGGDGETIFRSTHHNGKQEMMTDMWCLLDEADAVLHFNGRRFDVPFVNTEFAALEMKPPSPYRQIDLLDTAKRKFKLPTNKLAYVSKFFGLEGKVQHEGFPLWIKCMNGDADAWSRMREYNIQDVELLEDLYLKMLPWIDRHPNVALLEDGDPDRADDPRCTRCGGYDLSPNGYQSTTTGKYRRYRCDSCGGYVRDTKRLDHTPVTEVTS